MDAGLKEAGYSASERRNTEAALKETLHLLGTLLAGREALIREVSGVAERASSGEGLPAPEELKRIAEGLVGALAEAAEHTNRALSLFEAYRKSTPAFIDEFLAPEGIITKKRALDAKIRGAKEGVDQRRERIVELRRDNQALSVKIDEYRATLE